jgi:hypothetical protein
MPIRIRDFCTTWTGISMTEIQEGLKLIDSRIIALLASKRNFDPVKEMKYIEKAKTSKCRCKHWTGTSPCFYHTCRHNLVTHYGLTKVTNLDTHEVSYE